MSQQLAIDGGKPVRTVPLPLPYLGTSVIGKEELDLLTEVITKQSPFRAYGMNTPHMVDDFEKLAREYFAMPYALATATGTGSFCCAMAALGIGPGDEVIIPSFGWFTDFNVPVIFGATPVFADIDRSLNINPHDFKCKITPRTKAVIVIHFQGVANDMSSILDIANEYKIKVIEDCAQACGAAYMGRKVGSLGDVSCFSFQQNKIMSTGDGGLLLAKDPRAFERAVRYHDLGMVRPSLKAQFGEEQEKQFAGCQFRMNELTGAVALAQMRKLDSAIIDITRRYYKKLKTYVVNECEGIKFRQTDDEDGQAGIAFYMDMGTTARSGWFNKALSAEGIRVGPSSGCCNLLHAEFIQNKRQVNPKLPPFGAGWPGENVCYRPELCPKTDEIIGAMVCVALSPKFSDDDVRDVAEAIVKVWKGRPKELFG